MPTENDFPVRGRVLAIGLDSVVIAPLGTSYELQLVGRGDFRKLRNGQIADGIIRVQARKIWTVPSGGNFIEPIFGPPRTLQGRVRLLRDDVMVLQAGVPFVVDLPGNATSIDLDAGPLTLNGLANVAAMPGASFQPLPSCITAQAAL